LIAGDKLVKRPAPQFTLPALAILALLFAYNSCQGGLLKRKGFSSSSTQCKAGLYKGELVKMNEQAAPDPFIGGKVQLTEADSTGQVRAKASTGVIVRAGEQLAVIIDNSCVQQNQEAVAQTVITKSAVAAGGIFAGLELQTYLWTLDRDYNSQEIEALAKNESCVSGISWNKTYNIQSFNDSAAVYQTYLPLIRAEEAYARIYDGAAGMNPASGSPVIIAASDTGVDWRHPDLDANLWRHAYGIGIDITSVGTGGPVDYNPMDVSDIGHGTHVSGLIAAVSNNSIGIMGAMPYRAKIMAIKLFKRDATTGNISTTSQWFANAIRFSHLNGAHVINLSLGNITAGPNSDPVAESAINEAVANGSTVVTVTGNSDSGNGGNINGTTLTVIPGIYASKPGVIGVGSIDVVSGLKSNFSHYSTTYGEIAAPGAEQGTTGLYSTLPNNAYGKLAGTSQAAPLVSAAAGLVVGMIREARGVAPTPAEVERLILSSAVKDSRLQPYFKEGNRLDLLNLVQKINAEYPGTGSGSMDLSSVDCTQ
jgi:thermitase